MLPNTMHSWSIYLSNENILQKIWQKVIVRVKIVNYILTVISNTVAINDFMSFSQIC